MSTNVVLKGELREKSGTGPARELRRNGLVPGIIYGCGKKPVSISIEEKEITKLYRKHGFKSTVIEIEFGGAKTKVLPKAVDLHPITELVRHADFVFLPTSGTQKVQVPIVYEGKERSPGIKRGGFFNIIHRSIELDCPVDKIPVHVEIPVQTMTIGSSLVSNKIPLPDGCTVTSKKNIVLASITGRGGKADAADAEATPAAAAK